ncbi:LysR family transcriptional regulator [Rhodovulum sp. DZ06]|uniref:LysR family transcriptional regulator n=1 Tax=Rhodovulum sp. DZ06 TaxID=3425126 RepID=UPI003D355C59
MDWDDLRYFLQVARTGRLTAAARALGVDHATVSRRLAALEESLGAQLLHRSPRGCTLTDAGMRLLPRAEAVENAALLAAEEAGEGQALSGAVRVGIPEGAASHLTVEAAAELCARHPRLEVQFVATGRSFSLSQREADFAITISPPEQGRLRIRKIADYTLRLYAQTAYLDALPRGRPKGIEDLRRMRGVGYVQDLIFDPGLDYLSEVATGLHPRLTSTSLLVQLELVRAGAGVGILPDYMGKRHPELEPVLPGKVQIKRAYWLVLHENSAELARVRQAAEALAAGIRAKAAG